MSETRYIQPISPSDPALSMTNEFAMVYVRDTTNELLRAISRFDYSAFNTRPTGGGWSAGDIVEHLLLVDIAIEKLLLRESVPTERDYQEKMTIIEQRLTDRSQTIEAPTALRPSDIAKDPVSFSDKILNQRKQLISTIEKINLFAEFTETPNRLFGVLTGLEWVNFLVFHCRRHIEQLNQLPAGN